MKTNSEKGKTAPETSIHFNISKDFVIKYEDDLCAIHSAQKTLNLAYKIYNSDGICSIVYMQ